MPSIVDKSGEVARRKVPRATPTKVEKIFSLTADLRAEESFPGGIVKQGDAYDLFKNIRSASVDLIITSPPYWGHRTYGQSHDWERWFETRPEHAPSYQAYRKAGGVLGLEPNPDWYIDHLVEIFDWAQVVLKPSGSLWVNLGDTYFARWASIRLNGRQGFGNNHRIRRKVPMGGYRQEKQLLLIPSRFAVAMQNRHWILRNDLIWFKSNVPPRPELDRLRLSHEHFFHFVPKPSEGRAKYYYDLSAVEPGAHDVVSYTARAGESGHSATFPEGIVRPRILSSSPVGGVVLDPFCGTGRSLRIAVDSGRLAVGFELSPAFAASALASLRGIGAKTN